MHVLAGVLLASSMYSSAQALAVKSNLLYDILVTPSLGLEAMMSNRCSVNLFGSYMPGKINPKYYWATFSVQPELRYWPVARMAGPYLGAAYQYRGFNLAGMPNGRSQGHMQGGGLTVGWHHILSTHWSLEGSLMVGWSHLHWNEYDAPQSKVITKKRKLNYVGPLDLGLNLVYIIK